MLVASYMIGVFLCWLAYFTGDKVRRGTASILPGSMRVRRTIGLMASLAVMIATASFVYGFWVFDWWVPLVAVGIIPLSGVLYVWFEAWLSIAIVSVPALTVVGAMFLAYTLL